METHGEFAEKLAVEAAPQDVSAPIFRRLLSQGYNKTTWRTSASAVDAPCLAKDGDQLDLRSFINQTHHNAPIFSKTHVGCQCYVEVTGPPPKPPVIVTAFGIKK